MMGEILYEEEPIEEPVQLDPDEDEEKKIYSLFERDFLKKPGEHLLGIGITGSGKTQKSYWFAKQLLPHETLVWFDCGKSSNFGRSAEIGPLFTFGVPVNIIIPMGVDIQVVGSPGPGTILKTPRPADVWDLCEAGKINIVAINRFFLDPDLYAKYTAEVFRQLIILSQNAKDRLRRLLPMAIFHDEFQDVSPGVTMALSPSHLYSAKIVAWNINKLRSIGVRVCAFTQKYTFIYPNTRAAFSWILCCRGAYFEREDPDLAAFNRLYKHLDVFQAILWFPKRLFKHRWRFRLYQGPPGLVISHEGVLTNV